MTFITAGDQMFVFSALALLGNLSSGFLVFIKNEGATGLQMTLQISLFPPQLLGFICT